MAYDSIDKLQNTLAGDVFHYTKDAKKAAGRALGTLVEVITFYLLKAWKFEHSIGIETALGEYGNPEIKHNVEYSLHPILKETTLKLLPNVAIRSGHILKALDEKGSPLIGYKPFSSILLSADHVLRNSCLIATNENTLFSRS